MKVVIIGLVLVQKSLSIKKPMGVNFETYILIKIV